MKHPSRWPWLLRAPLCAAAILAIWWGPVILMLVGLKASGAFAALDGGVAFLLACAILFGWSWFVERTIVHPRIEPFFNIRSSRNPHTDRFTLEPVHSFRDWLRLMFLGR